MLNTHSDFQQSWIASEATSSPSLLLTYSYGTFPYTVPCHNRMKGNCIHTDKWNVISVGSILVLISYFLSSIDWTKLHIACFRRQSHHMSYSSLVQYDKLLLLWNVVSLVPQIKAWGRVKAAFLPPLGQCYSSCIVSIYTTCSLWSNGHSQKI